MGIEMFRTLPEGREGEENLGESRTLLRRTTLNMRIRGVTPQETRGKDQQQYFQY